MRWSSWATWVGVAGAVEAGDDPVEITEDLLVHLGQSLLTAGFGGGDDLQDLAAMLTVLGQKLQCCHEHRASQARVGVRTAFLNGQTAIAIRQCLGDTAESLLGPGGLGQRPVGSRVTVSPRALTLRAASQWRRIVVSRSRVPRV